MKLTEKLQDKDLREFVSKLDPQNIDRKFYSYNYTRYYGDIDDCKDTLAFLIKYKDVYKEDEGLSFYIIDDSLFSDKLGLQLLASTNNDSLLHHYSCGIEKIKNYINDGKAIPYIATSINTEKDFNVNVNEPTRFKNDYNNMYRNNLMLLFAQVMVDNIPKNYSKEFEARLSAFMFAFYDKYDYSTNISKLLYKYVYEPAIKVKGYRLWMNESYPAILDAIENCASTANLKNILNIAVEFKDNICMAEGFYDYFIKCLRIFTDKSYNYFNSKVLDVFARRVACLKQCSLIETKKFYRSQKSDLEKEFYKNTQDQIKDIASYNVILVNDIRILENSLNNADESFKRRVEEMKKDREEIDKNLSEVKEKLSKLIRG